jgi:hypothetical protein
MRNDVIMKFRFLIVGLLVFVGLFSTSLEMIGQVQIGTFADGKYPVYHLGYNLQMTADGNFMIFRGGNFQDNALVQTFDGVPNFSKWNGNVTDAAGLYLPGVEKMPEIDGGETAFCYDVKYNVVGWGLKKETIDFDAYKDDPNLRLYKNLKQAEKQVRTIIDTEPVLPFIPDIVIKEVSYVVPKADVRFDEGGNITTVRQNVTLLDNKFLVDTKWDVGFCDGCGERSVFIGPTPDNISSTLNLEKLDVSDLAGFDLAPITGYGSKTKPYPYSQSYVHVKTESGKPSRVFIDGDLLLDA